VRVCSQWHDMHTLWTSISWLAGATAGAISIEAAVPARARVLVRSSAGSGVVSKFRQPVAVCL